MAKGHDYYSITGLEVSEDNKLLAFAEDSVSRKKIYDIREGSPDREDRRHPDRQYGGQYYLGK